MTDLIVIEKTCTGDTQEYPVHRIVLYAGSEYFRGLFDSEMNDSSSPKVTITTDLPDLGPLEHILQAIYSLPRNRAKFYERLAQDLPTDTFMGLYLLCDRLQLEDHTEDLLSAIADYIPNKYLISWWKIRNELGQPVPERLENVIQQYLSKTTKVFNEKRYVELDTLIALWPTEDSEPKDPQTKLIQNFINDLAKDVAKLKQGGDNDPNEWLMSSESESCSDSDEETTNLYMIKENCYLDRGVKYNGKPLLLGTWTMNRDTHMRYSYMISKVTNIFGYRCCWIFRVTSAFDASVLGIISGQKIKLVSDLDDRLKHAIERNRWVSGTFDPATKLILTPYISNSNNNE